GGVPVARGARGGRVYLGEVAPGRLRLALDPRGSNLTRVAFSPDGGLLAAVNHGRIHTVGRRGPERENEDRDKVRLWDLATGQELGRFAGHVGGVECVAFAPDGRR